jgi:glycosyltransferase involved in cell wall biosynthesis
MAVKKHAHRIFKVVHILPELNEGGVERHVTGLANALCALNQDIVVVSAGGGLVPELKPPHLQMPVHRKNLWTGLLCAKRLAAFVRREKVDLLHTHSRVPAWIAYFTRLLSGVPFVVTAHARYSLNFGLWPIAICNGAICVSRSVAEHLTGRLPPGPLRVIYNAAPNRGDAVPWRGGNKTPPKRLLYLGRLSPKKGIGVLMEALALVKKANSGKPDENVPWVLDVVGEGPMLGELGDRARKLGFDTPQGKILFHGHSDTPGDWIAGSDLFLFPSLDEGMGLSLVEALRSGVPVLASDIPAVRELLGGGVETFPNLIPAGDIDGWARAIQDFLHGKSLPPLPLAVALPTMDELAEQTLRFYADVLASIASERFSLETAAENQKKP